MADSIFLKDYQELLNNIASLHSRINQIISQTNSMLDTIHTGYDFIETESQGNRDQNSGDALLNTLTIGIYGQVRAHVKTSEVNSDIEDTISSIRTALQALDKYNYEGNGLSETFSGILNKLYNADGASAEEIRKILDSYNLTTAFSPVDVATTSITELKNRNRQEGFDVRSHDSYGTMSLRQAFLGDFTDDCTMAGAGLGLIFQFIPGVDTIMDIRDVAADGKNITEYEIEGDRSFGKSAEVYGFTALDIAAFIPFVGCAKYIDDFADAGKTMGKVADVGKTIDNINDTRKNMKRAGDIVQAAKQGAKSGDNIVDAGKAAGKASDAGKVADGSKNTGKAMDTFGDTTKGSGKIADSAKTYDKSVLDSLDNTDNFKESTIEHIFEGNNSGGYHYNQIDDSSGKIIEGTQTPANSFGAYNASVEINGVPKNQISTFFPDDMAPQEVVDSINEAYARREFVVGTRNTYVGTANNGMPITMYIDGNDKIISAFPTYP